MVPALTDHDEGMSRKMGDAFGRTARSTEVTRSLTSRLAQERDERGRRVLVDRNAVPLPPFPEKVTWNPQDAIRMRHLMVGFFPTPQGITSMDIVSETMAQSQPERTNPLPGAILSTLFRTTWSSPDFSLVFAEQDFSAMMLAAAISAPEGTPIHADELLSEHGAVFFQDAIDLSDIWEESDAPVRAVSWMTVGFDRVFVTVWSESDLFPNDVRVAVSPYLTAKVFGFIWFGDENTGAVSQEAALIRSITAISRSEHARRQDVRPAKPRKLRPEYRDVPVRRLYLSNPEYGEAELASSRGKPHRLHWVRGHWRRQWFPKHEEHRTLWIDGHPRGNAALGRVGGEKVYVALAPGATDERKN